MSTSTPSPLSLNGNQFSQAIQQTASLDLQPNQELQITGIDPALCNQPTQVPPEQRLDAIEKIFNRILRDQHLQIDEIATDGSIRFCDLSNGTFSIRSSESLQLRVRPWDVNVPFQSLFDPNKTIRQFRFLPNQRVVFNDLNSRTVVLDPNENTRNFHLSQYLRTNSPQGFSIDIQGNPLFIGPGNNDSGLALESPEGLKLQVSQTGPISLTAALSSSAPVSQDYFTDLADFELPQEEPVKEKSCCQWFTDWIGSIFSAIGSFFSCLFCCNCS